MSGDRIETNWGIDLGGTKVEGVVLDAATGKVIVRKRIPTEASQGYAHIVGQIDKLVGLLESLSGVRRPTRIGIGTPGTTEPSTGLLKNSNTVCLNGQPLRADLTAKLGTEAVLSNDANCFALAEATLGAAAGYEVVFGVIMGTGVGGGVAFGGKVISGHHGIGGEWGHNVLDPDGPLCYCGKRGCVERVISGTAIERAHAERTGRPQKLPEIVALARQGDVDCGATILKLCDDFGRALSVIVNILDPDAIVLGGGVGNVDELLTLGREALSQNVFNPGFTAQLLRPKLGDSAGVFGAAMLVA